MHRMRPDDSLKLTIKRTEVIPADMPRDKALALRQQMIMQAFQLNLMNRDKPKRKS